MPKVCHISSVHKNTDGRIFRKECTALSQAGFETYYIAQGDSFTKNGVTVIGVACPSGRRERMTKTAREVFAKACEVDADIYHVHDPELIPWGVKLAKRNKIVIFDSHENYLDMIKSKDWIPRPVRAIANSLFNRYFAHAMKKYAAIIVVSPLPDNRMERYCDVVEIVSNYPDVQFFNEKQSLPREIIFAGGISSQWNHETVLDALAELDDATYVLCGPVEDSYLEVLKAHPSWSRVDYRGVVPFDEVQTLLRDSGVGIALLEPSENTLGAWGTLGNTKLFEEMAAGLPVVCTDFELWRRIRDQYACCICVCPHDKGELVDALQSLFADPDAAIAMGKRGQQAVKEQYSWSSEAKKLVALYRKLMVID